MGDLRPSSPRRLDLRSASDARDTNARLRGSRKRPLRGLHEKMADSFLDPQDLLRALCLSASLGLVTRTEDKRQKTKVRARSRFAQPSPGRLSPHPLSSVRCTKSPSLFVKPTQWAFSCRRQRRRFVSLRLAEGRRPKGCGGAWRRSCPRSDNRIAE